MPAAKFPHALILKENLSFAKGSADLKTGKGAVAAQKATGFGENDTSARP